MRHGRKIDGLLLVTLSAALVVAMQFGLAPSSQPSARQRSPWNFLIVVVDTLRYDVTSMAWQSNTPFIQAVAQRGASFSRAFSTHDNTPASHFTLFTGLRDGGGTAKDTPDMSLGYQFRERGYSTFGVAANGNLSKRWMQSVAGFTHYSNLYDDWLGMTAQDRARYLPQINRRLRQYGARENDWNQGQLFCSGPEVLARVRKVVESTAEPFFGFVNIIEPHDPYLPSAVSLGQEPDWARQVDADLRFRVLRYPLADPEHYPDPAGRASIMARLATAGGRAWSLSDDLSQRELETDRRRYAASVRDADQIVRAIFLELERKRVLDRTWVVIVSDHGESFGEDAFLTHSLSDKGNPEASFHVPMVWAPPSEFSGGMTVHDDVSLADVAPTIYDLAGIDWTPLKARASGEFGRSLIQYFAIEPEDRTATATVGAGVTDAERQRMREEALDRLRALGYIR
jgi:arylsulfatase A-like enzyme